MNNSDYLEYAVAGFIIWVILAIYFYALSLIIGGI